MKKSKIIIPALGMLILSTAASVTGTVAWFTTVSTAQANLTSFAVRKLGGDLGLVIKTAADGESYGVGTDLSGGSVVLAGTDPALCDASYKHTSTASVYKANASANAFQTVASSGWKVTSGGKDTYYAVSWTLEFTYTFGGDATNVNLYYDLDQASLTGTQVTAGNGVNASKETWKGFRIAFISGARTLVWAGGHTSSEASGLKYQAGTAVANATTYTSPNATNGDLVTGFGASGDYAAAVHASSEDDPAAATRADYIGTFTTANNTLSVQCIAWYEGNDANVVNGARMDTVAAVMAFYTRTAA